MNFDEDKYLELCNEMMMAIEKGDNELVKQTYQDLWKYLNSAHIPRFDKIQYMIGVYLMAQDRYMDVLEKESESKETDEISKVLNDALHPRF